MYLAKDLPSDRLLFAHVATGPGVCHVGKTLTFFLTQITVEKATHKLEKSQAADVKEESRARDRQQLGWTISWLSNVGANMGRKRQTRPDWGGRLNGGQRGGRGEGARGGGGHIFT